MAGGPYNCPVCGQSFTRKQHVGRHMRSHTGDKPYKCSRCDDKFARSDLLSRHVNKAHGGEGGRLGGTTNARARKPDGRLKDGSGVSKVRKQSISTAGTRISGEDEWTDATSDVDATAQRRIAAQVAGVNYPHNLAPLPAFITNSSTIDPQMANANAFAGYNTGYTEQQAATPQRPSTQQSYANLSASSSNINLPQLFQQTAFDLPSVMMPNQQMMGYDQGYVSQMSDQQQQVGMNMLGGQAMGMPTQHQLNTQLGLGMSPAPGMQYTLSSDGTVSDAGGLSYTTGNTMQAGPSPHIGNTFALDPSVSMDGLNVNATQMLASTAPAVTGFQTTEWPRSAGTALKKRKTRACVKCNGSKTKCDSEWPCARCVSRKVECVYLSRDQQTPVQQPTASTLPIGRLPANQMPMGNPLSAETAAWMESPLASQAVGKETQQHAMLIPQRINSSNSAHWSTPTLATENSPASDVSGHAPHVGVATSSAPMARSASDSERVVTPGNTTQALDNVTGFAIDGICSTNLADANNIANSTSPTYQTSQDFSKNQIALQKIYDDAQASWIRKYTPQAAQPNRGNVHAPIRPGMPRKRSSSLPTNVEHTAAQFSQHGYSALQIPNQYTGMWLQQGIDHQALASRRLSLSRPAPSVLQNTQPIQPAFQLAGGPLETLAPQRMPSFLDTPFDNRPKMPSHLVRPGNKRLASRTLGPEEVKRQSMGGDFLLFDGGWSATGRRNSVPNIASPYLDNGGGSLFGDDTQVGYPFPSPTVGPAPDANG